MKNSFTDYDDEDNVYNDKEVNPFSDDYAPGDDDGNAAEDAHETGMAKRNAHVYRRQISLDAGPCVFKQANITEGEDGNEPVVPSSRFVVVPWSKGYKIWWGFTVCCAFLTFFTETYKISFTSGGFKPYDDKGSILELVLVGIFVVDIVVNFFLAHYNEDQDIVTNHKQIALHYLRGMFWIDLVGVFPFYAVALALAGETEKDSSLSLYLSLLRLFRFVRLHRLILVFEILQYSSKVSLMSLTLIRNLTAALVWCHFSACVFYFIARAYNFDPDTTWIGGTLYESNLTSFERYLTSLYFAVVTFTTVGYGDYSPANPAEQIWGMMFMVINIIFASWLVGSMTLIIVKRDEHTGAYRDTLASLEKFSALHNLDPKLKRSLKAQLKLDFNNREVKEEQILPHFPTAIRRKVLRKIYLPGLTRTKLVKGLQQQFLDAFLDACKVEIISPGEDLLQRGSIATDLYFLIDGVVRLIPDVRKHVPRRVNGVSRQGSGVATSSVDSGLRSCGHKVEEITEGHFINEIGFFTESPQRDTVRTKTVCTTLTLSRSDYKIIAADYPESISILLNNLLEKVKSTKDKDGPGKATIVDDTIESSYDEAPKHVQSVQRESDTKSVEDLIEVHKNKLRDDNTTRFLYAASRGDSNIVGVLCEQGFDPNSSDYDNRTALMVASARGHTETVLKLIEYQANVNLVDIRGSSALLEAATYGNDDTVRALLQHGAKLCLSESQAFSKLSQAVFSNDTAVLRRLLLAGIDVDAKDSQKRTAAHIAGREGNLVALKLLAEYGASILDAKDRWNHTVEDEAEKSNSSEQMLEFIRSLKS